MPEQSEYEKQRLKNIEENRKILAKLGILNAFSTRLKVIKKAPKRKRAPSTPNPRKVIVKEDDSAEGKGSSYAYGIRRSSRLKGQEAPSLQDMEDQLSKCESEDTDYRRTKEKRPNSYGIIEGVEVGTIWQTRMECSYAGIHRPTVAGIHGAENGAYSIALSGGYEDDIDLGDSFTYTGEGGRDLKGTKANPKNLRTAAQSKDQVLARGNLALSRSVATGNPVRVIRGYKLNSPFAPEEGYRYDGLYKVEKFWFTIGLSGFGVYKFALVRLDNQPPPPWDILDLDKSITKDKEIMSDSEDYKSDSAYGGSHGDKSDTESVTSKGTSDKEEESKSSQDSYHGNKVKEERDAAEQNSCCGYEEASKDSLPTLCSTERTRDTVKDDDLCNGNHGDDGEVKEATDKSEISSNDAKALQ
ncbi:uncharacterized protein [Ptychodera flava]|uniref:uncharacterized protein isoform X2 n=1 Tax=Ptychodera flava TaxID=63121 RepID=UPI003969D5DE